MLRMKVDSNIHLVALEDALAADLFSLVGLGTSVLEQVAGLAAAAVG